MLLVPATIHLQASGDHGGKKKVLKKKKKKDGAVGSYMDE
jgi:hypothetical protein